MKLKFSLNKLKVIELGILNHLDSVCEKHNLKYFLSGGTLLGAIRHKGFIPWDDDIDIAMPRGDYHKLIELTKDDDRYKTISHYHTKNYFYPFAKMIDTKTIAREKAIYKWQIDDLGVYIDIFPVDGMPTDYQKRQKHIKKIEFNKTMLFLSLCKSTPKSLSFIKRILKPFAKQYASIVGYKYWLNQVEELARKYPLENSEIAGAIVAIYGQREILPSWVFEVGDRIEFEGSMYFAPVGRHEYLTSLYGDYMQLPPIDKRKSHHEIIAYWKEDV